jgi:hypothetical protein
MFYKGVINYSSMSHILLQFARANFSQQYKTWTGFSTLHVATTNFCSHEAKLPSLVLKAWSHCHLGYLYQDIAVHEN